MIVRHYIYLFLLLSQLAHSAPEISIATGEHPPFTSQTLPDGGLVNSIVTAAFKASGVTVNYRYLPWSRALNSTKLGVYSATSYWATKSQRDKYFYHSTPILWGQSVLISLRATGELNDLDSLNNKTVGAVRGYTYNKEFWQRAQQKKYQIDQVNSDEQNLKKLFLGRIDAMIIDRVVGQKLIQKNLTTEQQARLVMSKKYVVKTSVHLLISRKSPNAEHWLKQFNQGLTNIIKDGTYQQIMDKYPTINTGIVSSK